MDITAKPFDWNDNLSKEALEDFEGIRKDLPYCTCQNIGMALAKLELLEKQGQELKTGHWIRITDKTGHLVWECDKCAWQQRFNTNFCPDCGAKMESEDQV